MRLVGDETEKTRNVSSLSPEATAEEAIQRLQRVRLMRTRFPRLEYLCQPQSENFWVVGGSTGSFKTALLWNLALNAAENHHRVLFCALELTPAEMGFLALAKFSGLGRRRLARKFSPQVSEPFTRSEQEAWDAAVLRYQGLHMWLRVHGADEGGRETDDVLRAACRVTYEAVFVDHAGMIGRDSDADEFRVLNHAIHRMRGLSRGEVRKGYRPWVVVSTQLNRDIEKAEEERIPRMSDLRGSSRLAHDADVVVALQARRKGKAEDDPTAMLDGFVLKNRNGPPDSVLLFEANGATGLVVERTPEVKAPPAHWQDREDA